MEFKWANKLLDNKFNIEIDKRVIDEKIKQKTLESLLEDLNKITPLDKITNCELKFMQIQDAICTIELKYGMHPNKVVIGSDLLEDFKQYTNLVKVAKESELRSAPSVVSAFCGVPFEVDENNPKRLEIGYMIRLS